MLSFMQEPEKNGFDSFSSKIIVEFFKINFEEIVDPYKLFFFCKCNKLIIPQRVERYL